MNPDSSARGDEVRIGIGLSSMGFVLAGLGACVAILARDLDEPTSRLALLSSGFAAGLLVVAVVGPRLLRIWPMQTVLSIGSIGCAVGTVLLALAPVYAVAIAGGLFIGLGGALLVLVAPLMLNGPTAASRLSRVNAVASGAGILAPITIGALDALGPTGRLAMLAATPPLLLLAFLTRRTKPTHQPDHPSAPVLIDSAPAVGLSRKWLSVRRAPGARSKRAGQLGAGSKALGDSQRGASSISAPLRQPGAASEDVGGHRFGAGSEGAGGRLGVGGVRARGHQPGAGGEGAGSRLGTGGEGASRRRLGAGSLGAVRRLGRPVVMAVGRGWLRVVLAVAVEFCFVVWAVARLVATGLPTATAALLGSAFPIGMAIGRAIGPIHWRGWSPVVPAGLFAAAGTLLVSLFDTPAAVAVGLAVAGLGVAPLYPVTLAALVATPGLSPARLAAIGALASGTAILIAPAGLAVLARVVDLRMAYLITLPLLAALFLLSRRPRTSAPDEPIGRDDLHLRRDPTDSTARLAPPVPHAD